MTQNIDPNSNGAENPVIVDLGKKSRKAIKRLRKGTGKLMDEVNACIEELRESGAIDGAAQPVIVVVKEKASMPRWF
jgi:hypothetical protein